MLEIKNVFHSYTKRLLNVEISVLDDINLLINEGEFVSLVGKSGCGKTTLINIIAGYIQPVKGSVFLNGEKVVSPSKNRIVINQEYDLFDWMTVYQNMRLVSSNDDDINKYLSMTELNGFTNLYAYELSGGMKKRLSLARALVVNPKFIIMDEPFSSLDYQLREKIQEELLNIVKKLKKTVLFITHDIEEAVFLSDRIILLSGTPTRIKEEVFVSLPKNRNASIRDCAEFINFKKTIKARL